MFIYKKVFFQKLLLSFAKTHRNSLNPNSGAISEGELVIICNILSWFSSRSFPRHFASVPHLSLTEMMPVVSTEWSHNTLLLTECHNHK